MLHVCCIMSADAKLVMHSAAADLAQLDVKRFSVVMHNTLCLHDVFEPCERLRQPCLYMPSPPPAFLSNNLEKHGITPIKLRWQ
jgi:hypothetical protein